MLLICWFIPFVKHCSVCILSCWFFFKKTLGTRIGQIHLKDNFYCMQDGWYHWAGSFMYEWFILLLFSSRICCNRLCFIYHMAVYITLYCMFSSLSDRSLQFHNEDTLINMQNAISFLIYFLSSGSFLFAMHLFLSLST